MGVWDSFSRLVNRQLVQIIDFFCSKSFFFFCFCFWRQATFCVFPKMRFATTKFLNIYAIAVTLL